MRNSKQQARGVRKNLYKGCCPLKPAARQIGYQIHPGRKYKMSWCSLKKAGAKGELILALFSLIKDDIS